MKILFVISLLSFFALLWAAVAIMRHIRRSPAVIPPHLEPAGPSTPVLKPTRQAHFSTGDRSDWAHFNKDSGDLQDPAMPKRSRSAAPPSRKPSARRA